MRVLAINGSHFYESGGYPVIVFTREDTLPLLFHTFSRYLELRSGRALSGNVRPVSAGLMMTRLGTFLAAPQGNLMCRNSLIQ